MPSIFHNEVIELAVAQQVRSKEKYDSADNDLVRDALFVLSHDAVCVHRAIGSLVDSGWPGPAVGLLRTLLDINLSVLAIANSSNPAMAAFRYFYASFRRHARDQGFTSPVRRHMFDQIRGRIRLLPKRLRQQALDVIREKDRPYWYGQECATPADVIAKFGGPNMSWVYAQLSGGAHGSFMGMRLFRENPDAMSIEPESFGPKALSVDFTSCRLLAELLLVRERVEDLGEAPSISAFIQRVTAAALSLPR